MDSHGSTPDATTYHANLVVSLLGATIYTSKIAKHVLMPQEIAKSSYSYKKGLFFCPNSTGSAPGVPKKDQMVPGHSHNSRNHAKDQEKPALTSENRKILAENRD